MFRRRPCLNGSPKQRHRDDAVVLGSSLFAVFLSLFIVLVS
jgi:hypothetical protein